MKFIRSIEANPNTKVRAYWYRITEKEFNDILNSNYLLYKTTPITNGINYQTFELKEEKTLYKNENGTYNYVEIKQRGINEN